MDYFPRAFDLARRRGSRVWAHASWRNAEGGVRLYLAPRGW